MLLESAGLSLLKIDGTRAIANIHDPIENIISCQCILFDAGAGRDFALGHQDYRTGFVACS